MGSSRDAFSVKRVVLNPRAYLRPFAVCVLAHHVPFIVAFAAIARPSGYEDCARLDGLFDWLLASFALHTATAGLMIASILVTLCQPVYRLRRPENGIILLIFALYGANLFWTIYGEANYRLDTSGCSNDSDAIQDAADSVGYIQHLDFVITVVVVGLGCCSSYLCGVHTSLDMAEAEQRWQRRCTRMFHAFTCRRTVPSSSSSSGTTSGADSGLAAPEPQNDEEDIFQSLGKILGRFFVVRYNTERFEGLQFNDLAFMLGLVSKSQRQERREARERAERGEAEPRVRLPEAQEEARLRDLAFFGKLAIGIYGWPIYVWYSPFYWFRVFGCFSKPTAEQAFDHDNALQGNRASFVGYTGIRSESLVYLNCYNFVFQAPYSIVKDPARRELIISVRGSMSFYDFVTDGLAKVSKMLPDELPLDVPNRHATRTHYGMLRTARQLYGDLQVGTRKQLFWDFAVRHCAAAGACDAENGSNGAWKIVVCGHSMGAGVGAILSVLLKKDFPTTKAFLYAPPMMFDPVTAAWTKSFMTTAVYGDDIVPRLSIANVTHLRDEMATHFHEVAYEPLFRVKYGGLRRKTLAAPGSSDSVEIGVVDGAGDAVGMNATATAVDSDDASQQFASSQRSTTLAPSPAASDAEPTSAPEQSAVSTTSRRETRASRVLDLNFLRVSELDDSQHVDVPGEIIHIQTVKAPRKCSCTVVLGEQQLTYTVRDASYFRRIWVNARAVQDHMVHHYDRQIAHLVNNCMDFSSAAPAVATGAAVTGAHARASSDLSASSWIEASTSDDASTVTPYREVDEIV
ncbi:hypothetical protein PybrP1_007957 [[Pythium] brassicae (nom. inval.)]|nr:hypothetical protein PybrP1_007957 [[Pythium] brassicae (nom. inval.)]